MNGHSQAQHMVDTQPMKMAAAEGLWETEDPASFSLFTIGNMAERKDVWSLRLPNLLSLLAYNQLYGPVQGINDLQAQYEAQYGPGNYVPPAIIPYWTFRIMVGSGTLMLVLAIYGLFLAMGDLFAERPLALKIFLFSIALPYLANSSGWLLTEVGRYPWAVFGLLKLEDAVSPNVTPAMLLISLIGYVVVYSVLIYATVYLMRKYAKAGLPPVKAAKEKAQPALAGAHN
jgi:cytochrome d ubiquinol oxidase subunit I